MTSVEDPLITPELARRSSRAPDYAAENQAMNALIGEMTDNPAGVLQKLSELVVDLCRADSAAIIMLEGQGEGEVFRWDAAAGAFATYLGRTTPRYASSCGIVMSRNEIILFSDAGHFPEVKAIEPAVYENLLVPLEVSGIPVGTLWAVSHSTERRFDAEDARLLRSLARFAAAAHQMNSALKEAKSSRTELETHFEARLRNLSELNESLRISEARYRAISEIRAVGAIYLSMEGAITAANDIFLAMIGYTREEFQSATLTWQALTPPEWMQASEDALAEALLTGQSTPYEKEYFRKNGSRVWALFAGKQLPDGTWFELVIDMTSRKRAEQAQHESEEQFRLLVENVREYALVQTDAEGRVTSWNPGAERLFGYTSAEMLGRNFSQLLTPEDRRAGILEEEYAYVTKGGRNEDARWLQRKDGTRFWGHWVTEPVRDEIGQLRGVAKVLRDETERQRVQDSIQQSLAEKEALLKEVHHRVKNNLQVITSLLSLQTRQIEDENVLSFFEEARNRVQSIASIHELLYRSEFFAAIQLSAYARQFVPDLVRSYHLEERVAIDITGDQATLELERAVTYGLLLNELISNACKHAFSPSRTGTIAVKFRLDGGDIELTVADNGHGLPQGFDYRQASSLGLQLVRSLTRQLRGNLEVQSGQGTTVRVRFPALETPQ